ncbi:MAG TPA: transcriptional regulator [Thiolapillus brandeum]|uniref:Transcriptional regulator n=1 Tax=Thiolapillus brandeum TaxID=1076588 RepID=A0A7C5MU60_9GAMM|nr:transcriptional regulator [Thiolapillus brandeum]
MTEINGPLKIMVVNEPEAEGWQLLVRFTDEFKSASLEEQGETFARYRQELVAGIQQLSEGDRNRDGMAIVLQLVNELLPYIREGQIALEEAIVVQIGRPQAVSITDFLNG